MRDDADWADASAILKDGRRSELNRPAHPRDGASDRGTLRFRRSRSSTTGSTPMSCWAPGTSQRRRSRLDLQRTRRTQTYTRPEHWLVLRCVVVEYRTSRPWSGPLHFKNAESGHAHPGRHSGDRHSQYILAGNGDFLLRHHVGSPATARDFAPLETALRPWSSKRISAAGGRPTNSDLFLLQSRMGPKGPDSRNRLAGPVGGRVCPPARRRPAGDRPARNGPTSGCDRARK